MTAELTAKRLTPPVRVCELLLVQGRRNNTGASEDITGVDMVE